MEPTVILDKSAIQSLGRKAIRELNRYFYTVIPPVLLYEILADLSLDQNNSEKSNKRVADVAQKLLPPDSYVNLDFRQLCMFELLGDTVEMGRRPIIGGARDIASSDGRRGVYVGVQPHDDALFRWRGNDFDQGRSGFRGAMAHRHT